MKNSELIMYALLEKFMKGFGKVISFIVPIGLILMGINVGRSIFIVEDWRTSAFLFFIAAFLVFIGVIMFIKRKNVAEL